VEALEAPIPQQAPRPSSLIRAAKAPEVVMSKSSDKPKKQQKQKPQKTLKERRTEKRAAKKFGSGSLLSGQTDKGSTGSTTH
jgi:hypothetical protein